MKRILLCITTIFLLCILPVPGAKAQEKKTEKRSDKSGLIVSGSDVKSIYITVDEEGNLSTDGGAPEKDEKEIIIRSSDGEEIIKIKGDAVISIVDGKVKVEAGEMVKKVEKEVIKKKK